MAAYVKRIGHKRAVKPLERLAANTYGASIAEVMVGKLLTQERLMDLTRQMRSIDSMISARRGVTIRSVIKNPHSSVFDPPS